MIDWILNQPMDGTKNYTWLFSGLGGTIILALIGWFLRNLLSNKDTNPSNINQTSTNTNTQSVSNIINLVTNPEVSVVSQEPSNKEPQDVKHLTHILFIDDDVKFKVSKILVKSGWVNTKIIKDVSSIDCIEIKSANILFIDIQGVGLILQFSNEGLGLSQAIKQKWPEKKVIIYSAETQGNRFDNALRQADDFIAKNAEPYEFINLVENYSAQIFGCEK